MSRWLRWALVCLVTVAAVPGCWVPLRPPHVDPDVVVDPHVDPVVPPPVEPEVRKRPAPVAVLIVEETADRALPGSRSWVDAVESPRVREWLRARCLKDENGNPKFRIWDQDKELDGVGEYWRDAMRLPRSSVPWIAITTEEIGIAGPLPESEEELLKLLKEWGGE